MSNINAIKKQAELLLAKMEGKRYFVRDLNNRLQKVANDYPQDTVITAVARVMEQLDSKDPGRIISQAEFGEIYEDLVGLNVSGTNFRRVLGDLLITEPTKTASPNDQYVGSMRDSDTEMDLYVGDKDIKSQLDGLFSPAANKYDPKLASKAKERVNTELTSIGYYPKKIELVQGDAHTLLFAADFDTRAGLSRIYIPADATGKSLPSVFIGEDKPVALSSKNLRDHFEKVATISQLSVGENVNSIEMDKVAMPEALKDVVEENVVESAMGFPPASIRLAKRMLLVELASMGFKGSQILIKAQTQDGFICEATLNTMRGKVAIEIPIEMNGNIPLMPKVFANGDFVDEFTAPKLQLFASKIDNHFTVGNVSSLMEADVHELQSLIVKAAVQEDFATCDEILDVISQRFDEDTYRGVVADYNNVLTNIKTSKDILVEAYDNKSEFVKTPNSIYPIHRKLGRPAHELIKDENGQYQLKSTYYSRKNQEASAILFNTAKILVGEDE